MQYGQPAFLSDQLGGQIFAQPISHPCHSVQYSDVPGENGQLSDALWHKMAEEDILAMEVLLRYRGIRTLRSLESLESVERAVLLCKARELYGILGIFPSNIKKTLNKLFGDVPQQPMFQHFNNAWTNPYMHPQWAGHDGWGHHAIPDNAPESLADPLPDDTYLRRTLGGALLGAREIVGWERYAECLRRLKRSDELVVASCMEAAEALAALGIRKEDVRDREHKEALKAAKKAVRDVLLWRCTGHALGLDSREALVRSFEEAVRHTHCDENAVSQLTNGYRRIREELAGGPPPNVRTATSPERRTGGGGGDVRSRSGGTPPTAGPAQGDPGGATAATAAPSESWQASAEGAQTEPPLVDPNLPSDKDPVKPDHSDTADLQKEKPEPRVFEQSLFAGVPWLDSPIFPGEKLPPVKERRSCPPTRLSPGPRNRDAGNNVQIEKMFQMLTMMSHQLQDVKSQVGNLQQNRETLLLCADPVR
jgi:hypothetical protein